MNRGHPFFLLDFKKCVWIFFSFWPSKNPLFHFLARLLAIQIFKNCQDDLYFELWTHFNSYLDLFLIFSKLFMFILPFIHPGMVKSFVLIKVKDSKNDMDFSFLLHFISTTMSTRKYHKQNLKFYKKFFIFDVSINTNVTVFCSLPGYLFTR